MESAVEAAKVGVVLIILEFILIFFFSEVISSMWILDLTLQFLVYIALWRINYPE